MKRLINLGKVDYLGFGKRTCQVTIEIEIENKRDNKPARLSICGNIWNHLHTDVYSCGQNIKLIASLVPTKRVNRIKAIWERWHLNDMHAGCEHQRTLGWEKDGYKKHPSEPCPTCGYKFGTKWLTEELPSEIVSELETI